MAWIISEVKFGCWWGDVNIAETPDGLPVPRSELEKSVRCLLARAIF